MKWNDFETNVSKSFANLRTENHSVWSNMDLQEQPLNILRNREGDLFTREAYNWITSVCLPQQIWILWTLMDLNFRGTFRGNDSDLFLFGPAEPSWQGRQEEQRKNICSPNLDHFITRRTYLTSSLSRTCSSFSSSKISRSFPKTR